ncbi:MAG: sigma-70 family RNA polymerase sigma factor [Anaerolineae bacterium]
MNAPIHAVNNSREASIIADAQRGDLRAFEQLVATYQAMAYSVAYHILGNSEAAMDATQEAFLRAFQGLSRYRGGSFKGWILRIATNCSYDQLRYQQRRPSSPIDDLVEDEEHSSILLADDEEPEEYAERQELGQAIQRGLAELPHDQRAVLVMSDLHGLSYTEIADAMQVSVGTVKSRLSRARSKLRDYMVEHEELLPGRFRLGVDQTES